MKPKQWFCVGEGDVENYPDDGYFILMGCHDDSRLKYVYEPIEDEQ